MKEHSLRRMVIIGEVAEFLKVKKATLYSWVSNGKIPSYKLNGLIRFDMDEIEGWVEQSKYTPAELPKSYYGKASAHQDIDAIVKGAIESVTERNRILGRKSDVVV